MKEEREAMQVRSERPFPEDGGDCARAPSLRHSPTSHSTPKGGVVHDSGRHPACWDLHHHQGSSSSASSGVAVSLDNSDLWRRFHRAGTEMIITKTGRRMFPALQVSVAGLDPEAEYSILLEVAPACGAAETAAGGQEHHHRLRFSGREWVVAGRGEAQAPPGARTHVHPDSPAKGRHWMSSPVSFSRLKLTNNSLEGRGHVVLTSMHRYVPRVHVVEATRPPAGPAPGAGPSPLLRIFSFPETEFVAVTAYQNSKITKLKIEHNPFAKGFREGGLSKRRRLLLESAATPPRDGDRRRGERPLERRHRRPSPVSSPEAAPSRVAEAPATPSPVDLNNNNDEDSELSGKFSPVAIGAPLGVRWVPYPQLTPHPQLGAAALGHHHASSSSPYHACSPWTDARTHDTLLLLWASLAQQADLRAAATNGCAHRNFSHPVRRRPLHRYLDPRLSLPPSAGHHRDDRGLSNTAPLYHAHSLHPHLASVHRPSRLGGGRERGQPPESTHLLLDLSLKRA